MINRVSFECEGKAPLKKRIGVISTLNRKADFLENDNFEKNNSVSFGGKFPSKKLTCIVAGLTALIGTSVATMKTIKIASQYEICKKEDVIHKWNPNIKVYGSITQDLPTTAHKLKTKNEKGEEETIIFPDYLNALLGILKHEKVRSLNVANEVLKVKSYGSYNMSIGLGPFISIPVEQKPVFSPHELNMWEKENKKAERYVLVMTGSDWPEEAQKAPLEAFKRILGDKDTFKVPEENFMSVKYATPETFKKGIENLIEKVKKSKNKDVEVLIYYFGHGNPGKEYVKLEGFDEGKLNIGVSETQMKNWINKIPSSVKTAVIIDSCHSGAFIAKHQKIDNDKV